MSTMLHKHMPLLSTVADDIKKLRSLIFYLAVRGKLVPQDPHDEPASELLQRIAQVRTKRLAAATGRQGKRTSLPETDGWPFTVPNGWAWSRVGDLSEIIRGVSYDKSQISESALPGYRPLLRGHNINKTLNIDRLVFVQSELISKAQLVQQGDVVIAMSSGSAHLVGKAAQADTDLDCGFGAFCGVIRALSKDLHPYFGFFFQTPLYRTRVAGHGKGIGINNLQKGSLQLLECPIPPLAEQRRIVAKVDELMAMCDRLEAEQANADSAHATLVETLLGTLTQSAGAADFAENWKRIAEHFDTLFTTELSVDALKQAVLQLAVMGKLVPQEPNDEPSARLIERVAQEKARLDAKGSGKKAKPIPVVKEDETPFVAPEGWQWQRLEELLTISGGVTLGRKLGERSLISRPYLRVANVQRGYLLLTQMKTIEVPVDEQDKYRLVEGDLLITEGGDWDKVGRTAIWRNEIDDCLHQNHVFKARRLTSDWNSRWTEMYLNAAPARAYFAASSKQTTNLASINMTQLKACPFPVPPLPEQSRIVAKFDELMALCDHLRAELVESCARHERLASTLIESALKAA